MSNEHLILRVGLDAHDLRDFEDKMMYLHFWWEVWEDVLTTSALKARFRGEARAVMSGQRDPAIIQMKNYSILL